MVNLDQTTTKIDETWGIASSLPREHISKRSRPKDQRIVRIIPGDQKGLGFSQELMNSNLGALVIPGNLALG